MIKIYIIFSAAHIDQFPPTPSRQGSFLLIHNAITASFSKKITSQKKKNIKKMKVTNYGMSFL